MKWRVQTIDHATGVITDTTWDRAPPSPTRRPFPIYVMCDAIQDPQPEGGRLLAAKKINTGTK